MRVFNTVEEALEFMKTSPNNPYDNDLNSLRKVVIWLAEKALVAAREFEVKEIPAVEAPKKKKK